MLRNIFLTRKKHIHLVSVLVYSFGAMQISTNQNLSDASDKFTFTSCFQHMQHEQETFQVYSFGSRPMSRVLVLVSIFYISLVSGFDFQRWKKE